MKIILILPIFLFLTFWSSSSQAQAPTPKAAKENLIAESSTSRENLSTPEDAEFPFALVITLSLSGTAAVGAVIGFTWKKNKCHLNLSFRAEEAAENQTIELEMPALSIAVEAIDNETAEACGHVIYDLICGISECCSSPDQN